MTIRDDLNDEYASARRSWLSQLRMWFAGGRYDMIADQFCHEGLKITSCCWDEDYPVEERWLEIGICSRGEKVLATELEPEYRAALSPCSLIDGPISVWPVPIVAAMRRLAEHILSQFESGIDGC